MPELTVLSRQQSLLLTPLLRCPRRNVCDHHKQTFYPSVVRSCVPPAFYQPYLSKKRPTCKPSRDARESDVKIFLCQRPTINHLPPVSGGLGRSLSISFFF